MGEDPVPLCLPALDQFSPVRAVPQRSGYLGILAPSNQVGEQPGHLTGIATSPGTCRGPARVIKGESDFHKLRAGDVLVCPVTSPVWSVLFPSVAALATDTGGRSRIRRSSREFGIPAVVATRNATAVLRDGQTVVVDGTAGTVRIEP